MAYTLDKLVSKEAIQDGDRRLLSYVVELAATKPFLEKDMLMALKAVISDIADEQTSYKGDSIDRLSRRRSFFPITGNEYWKINEELAAARQNYPSFSLKPGISNSHPLYLKVCDLMVSQLSELEAGYSHWWNRKKAPIARCLAQSVSSYKWASKW